MKKSSYLLPVLLILAFSCSTEKNKFFNRSYHNTTARFNGYFNAGVIIQESLEDFHIANKDDYTKILPVFIIPGEETSKSLFAPMDKAILKTSTVIKKHSMPNPEKKANKKEEWCKWIDDNWMVMGKAYFYKRDFAEARTRFEYVFKQYQDKPIKYEALLWNAKNYMEMNNFPDAESALNRLQDKMESQTDKAKIAAKKKEEAKKKKSKSKYKTTNLDPDMYSSLYDDIEMTWADFYLRKKDYTKAEVRLKKSLEICKSKKQRARIHFILGQLAQVKGDRNTANFHYAKVDKLNPEYEMEFYSRIFRALNYDGGNSAGLKRQLLKMARDEKNKDYLDQIYYALAEIEFKENDKPEGIAYLQKSVKYSTTNVRQKGLSYKRLGDLYYDDKKFIPSKSYYDSTIANLPKEYENYDQVKEKSESLKDLVNNLLIIQKEDSLQRIGRMTDKEKEKYIDDIIKKEDEEAERQRQIEENKANQLPTNNTTVAGTNSSWYFYNSTIMSQGFVEFKKIYGVRKLEDDWRRSDKSVMLDINDQNDTTANETTTVDDKNDPIKRREAYLKKLPSSEKDFAASDEKLRNALYNAGAIYNDRLREQKLAIECFDRIISKHKESDRYLPTNFQLYVIYSNAGNPKAEEFKDYILKNHPDSEYAKIIRNPNFKKEEAFARKADERKYEEIYGLYSKKQFESTLTACNEIISNEPKNNMLPRYYYLRALTYGELKQYENFEKALSETAALYPKEEIGIAANELLALLRNRNSILNASEGKSTYIYEAEAEHFFILVFTSKMGSVNDAKAKISNFNMTSFSTEELKITNNFLNTEDQMILVKRFPNRDKAMNYYQAFNLSDMLPGLAKKCDYFVITNKNYASFYIEKKVEDYKAFFEKNYLK